MEWPELTERLAATLRELTGPGPERTLIIASTTEDSKYTQYAVDGGTVWAEVASGKKFLPRQLRLNATDEQTLRDAGWEKPSGGMNWTSLVGRGAAPGEFQALAERSVVGLRDVLAVAHPDQLHYEAFHSADGSALSLPNLGLPAN